MKREIKFSLVFRDMWQSAGKYVPTVDQLTRVAPAIIEMGCFARVETAHLDNCQIGRAHV